MSKTSEQIIQEIKQCKDTGEAKKIIKEIISALNMSRDMESMTAMSNAMKQKAKEFEALQTSYDQLEVPRPLHEVQDIRTQANFIYREFVDEFVFDVVRLKALLEESKTIERATALSWLQENKKDLAKSTLRDYLGDAPNYSKWSREWALAYANYQYLLKTLDGIKMFADTLASELRGLGQVEKTDVK